MNRDPRVKEDHKVRLDLLESVVTLLVAVLTEASYETKIYRVFVFRDLKDHEEILGQMVLRESR